MNNNILQKLNDWRAKTARRENVELFRIISNQAIEEIADKKPQNKSELLEIKGIKEKKFAKYGGDILGIVKGEGAEFIETFKEENKIFEVSEYLDFLNEKLFGFEARVKGEVSSVDLRGNYVFFCMKDKKGECLINCFIWRNDFEISGVKLEEGMEVVVWGYPNVYKPSGRLSFQTKIIELVGEGLLKKAYEELRKKLEMEGIFAPERKKSLPKFVKEIGLITSHQGAAIGDFISNVGNYGFKIKFYDSRVEGKQAIFDLAEGINWFNKKIPGLDAIVLVRGGGSLESLQAFNTEAIVRQVAASKIPIVAGIGHEQDVTLAALAADLMVSTPTAAALAIRRAWDEAIHAVDRDEKNILNSFNGWLADCSGKIFSGESLLSRKLAEILERFRLAKENFQKYLVKIEMMIGQDKNYLENISTKIVFNYARLFSNVISLLKTLAENISLNDPERQLRLGYSLVSLSGKIVRSAKEVKAGDEIDIKVSDGEFKSKITSVIASKEKQS